MGRADPTTGTLARQGTPIRARRARARSPRRQLNGVCVRQAALRVAARVANGLGWLPRPPQTAMVARISLAPRSVDPVKMSARRKDDGRSPQVRCESLAREVKVDDLARAQL